MSSVTVRLGKWFRHCLSAGGLLAASCQTKGTGVGGYVLLRRLHLAKLSEYLVRNNLEIDCVAGHFAHVAEPCLRVLCMLSWHHAGPWMPCFRKYSWANLLARAWEGVSKHGHDFANTVRYMPPIKANVTLRRYSERRLFI